MNEQRQVITNRVAFLEQKIPGYAAALGIAGLVVLWEIVCRMNIVPPLFLPAPSAILTAAWDMLVNGELIENLLAVCTGSERDTPSERSVESRLA